MPGRGTTDATSTFAGSGSVGLDMYSVPYLAPNTNDLVIPGTRVRAEETLSKCVENDISKCGLSDIDLHNRDAWRGGVRRCLVLPTPSIGTWTAI